MILSNRGIKEALKSGAIEIDPPPEDGHYDTSSVDLMLDDDFQMWDKTRCSQQGVEIVINLAAQKFTETAENYLINAPLDNAGCLTIPPYHSYPWHFLGQTRSRIVLNREHRIAARVEGKSSLARLGLIVHLTAPIIHSGFRGHIALELINFGPFTIKLVPYKTRICQLVFERLESDAEGDPTTTFMDQTRPGGTHEGL